LFILGGIQGKKRGGGDIEGEVGYGKKKEKGSDE